MGKIGVKVWILKGNLMPGEKADQNVKMKKAGNGEEKAIGGRRRKRAVEAE